MESVRTCEGYVLNGCEGAPHIGRVGGNNRGEHTHPASRRPAWTRFTGGERKGVKGLEEGKGGGKRERGEGAEDDGDGEGDGADDDDGDGDGGGGGDGDGEGDGDGDGDGRVSCSFP